ncbi:efflux RND transporter permease subunit, partial [Geofilum rubicundum]|uniref:efflux RND transporter permease subunit n=1 Tax=Geofilum rubicundum TaxID=472113 RepID=UPI00138E3AC2
MWVLLMRERTGNLIRKENQEYLLVVQYDFLGPWELNNRVRKRNLEQLNERLPVGFTAHDKGGYSHWRKEESSQYWLLLVVIGVVFLLCAILFESFLQPLAVIASIPVAMIG